MANGLEAALAQMPLVAILRGVKPNEVVAIGHALVDAGFSMIEVPLNSPDPMESIAALASVFGETTIIGAGTVTTPRLVEDVAQAGGKLIVMPHADTIVIRAAKTAGMFAVPGFSTPTEAFAALAAGADGLKLFPAEASPPPVLKAMRAVIPAHVPVLPVGGITPVRMADYRKAGASGFGLGSALYSPGASAEDVATKAAVFVEAWRALAA
ncbi:MAG: 2-dehydro-3-deoxy-6-phosphogalactonate aldolase [Alphaproteobacteria bacterium]